MKQSIIEAAYDYATEKTKFRKHVLKFEFSNDQHCELAKRLHSIEGKAMISSYDCPLMQELYGDWTMIKFPSKKNNIRSSEVQEVIWINYKPRSTQSIFE